MHTHSTSSQRLASADELIKLRKLFLWGKGYLSVGRALEKGDFPLTVLRVFPFLISLATIKVISN